VYGSLNQGFLCVTELLWHFWNTFSVILTDTMVRYKK
jgi:hypothetical protein